MLVTTRIQHSARGKSRGGACLRPFPKKYRIKDRITGIHKTIYGAKNVGLPNNCGKLRITGMLKRLSSVGTSAMNVAKNHTKQILKNVDLDLHVSNTTK
ncbi:MAG: hypothetical protein Q7J67_02325 [bacterium]|nr:hypothetical protein [bacterium]